jgi:ribosome maturation factor RimP
MIDLENDDTIQIVDYVKADILTAGQLMIDDCIQVADEVVSIIDIVSLPDGYTLEVVNDFGERDIIEVGEYDQFDLMILQ